jgi:type VI secretion system protein ImpH
MADKALNDQFLEEPFRFEFFQAVRMLRHVYRDRRMVGGAALPADEIVRFRSRVGLDFPASEIHEAFEVLDEQTGRSRLEMIVNFMGLLGVGGALPVHYTEVTLDRVRHRDTALWSFLDIFSHRAVSMFFRAWEKYRFPVGYEGGDDRFTGYLYDFSGLGTDAIRGRMHLRDEELLPYSGLISQRPHSANALENVISDYFGTRAKTIQFFGQWLRLEPQDWTRVGAQNNILGRNAIAGTNIWNQQSKFRLQLGPLTFKQFEAFLPDGTAHKKLDSIIRFMVGQEIDYDVQLLLKGRQVPGTILTTRAMRKPKLGWTSYLKTVPFTESDDQVVLELKA